MKLRNGYVSNSSSSSFVLDKRTEGVVELLELVKNRKVSTLAEYGLGRSTAYGEMEEVLQYIKEMRLAYYSKEDAVSYVPMIIQELEKVILEIDEHIVMFRESDEGMGGLLFGDTWGMTDEKEKERIESLYKRLKDLAVVELETH